MSCHFPKEKNGFTLIEMAVTTAIILISTGAALASFNNFNNRQQVETSVTNSKSFIRTALRKAQAQDTPGECINFGTDPRPLQGYRVYANGNQLLMGANCGIRDGEVDIPGDPNSDDVPRALVGEISQLLLPNGVVFHTNFDMRFWTLYGGGETLNDPIISISKGSYRYEYTVSEFGEISEGSWVLN